MKLYEDISLNIRKYCKTKFSNKTIILLKKLDKKFPSFLFIFFPPKIFNFSIFKRILTAYKLDKIQRKVTCTHIQSHILPCFNDILKLSEKPGIVVEAGCYKGGSSAKFSLAAKKAKKDLYIFDSFEGLPENNEPHDKNIYNGSIKSAFIGGKYCGTKDEVKNNIRKFGEYSNCRFIKGWLEKTLPSLNLPISVAYIDVDLASSTKTCLKYLYPLLIPGGALYSQDGDFPLVLDVFNDDNFWKNEVGCKKPKMEGIGTSKIIKITKPLL
jgi:O-methyltransferase